MDAFKQAMALVFTLDRELWHIIGVTLRMSLTSTAISCIIGIPLGVFLGSGSFRGKSFVMRILYTLMGLPPVVAGLFVFLMLSHSGPLGSFKLLFSVEAMVIAQCILIIPIVTGLCASVIGINAPGLLETANGLRLPRRTKTKLLLLENRVPLVSVALTGFGRAISEVGAVNLVGGNIQYKTRVMTTAIMLETNKGNFEFAIALGFILITIAFIINFAASFLKGNKFEN
jgi:tungstate transport system permease protein